MPRYVRLGLFTSLLFILLVAFLKSPLNKVQKIMISGCNLLLPEEIERISGVKLGDSWLMLDRAEAVGKLKQLIAMQEVELIKSFPSEIQIKIREYLPVAVYNDEDREFLILANGSLYQLSKPTEQVLPTLTGEWREEELRVLAKQLACAPLERVGKCFISKDAACEEQLQVVTSRKHTLHMRLEEMAAKLELYTNYLNLEPGELYLLETTCFKALERKHGNKG
ncbi:MAG: hypothetical protein RLZ12_383 [Bacillota bacterium]|jgi:cell division septal protein FtsQ